MRCHLRAVETFKLSPTRTQLRTGRKSRSCPDLIELCGFADLLREPSDGLSSLLTVFSKTNRFQRTSKTHLMRILRCLVKGVFRNVAETSRSN
jgi:hypothetical protein